MSSNGRARLDRAEKNEEAFKAHNERRAAMEEAGHVPDDEPVPFACECDDAECAKAIELPLGEYERAVKPVDRFVVAPATGSSGRGRHRAARRVPGRLQAGSQGPDTAERSARVSPPGPLAD